MYKSVYFCLFLLAIGCGGNEYELPYNDYSSFWLTTTEDAGDQTEFDKIVNQKEFIAFFDLSRNAVSHKWITPTSTKFLSKDFTEGDSIYTDYIIGNRGESTDKLVNVYFPEGGQYEVKLENTFRDSVNTGVYSVEKDLWVVHQTFSVDVYADTNPAAKILFNEVEVFVMEDTENPSLANKASWPVLNIEAGDELVFVDASTEGRPSGSKWVLEGAKPETGGKDTLAVLYNKFGEYTVSLASVRKQPSKTVEKPLPVIIKVNPSNKPFVINGKVTMDADGVISFAVTGEVDAVFGQADKFKVHVTNNSAGFDEAIAVESVAINSEDATIIELTLASPIFNTDKIDLSFTGGNITSVDARVLADFGPLPISVALGNTVLIDSWAGYELEATNWKKANAEGYFVGKTNGTEVAPVFSRVTDKLFSGNASMRYSSEGISTVTLQGSNFSVPNGVPSGTYFVSYKVFLETGNTMQSFTTIVDPKGGDKKKETNWDVSEANSVERGKWIEISQEIVLENSIDSGVRFDLKVDEATNVGVTGTQIIYFDDLKFIPLVPRE